jgi:hypothetical protein
MTGEKIKPLLIGKSRQPRCFQIKPETSPVTYRYNKKAWMTSKLSINGRMVDEFRLENAGSK